MKIVVATFEQLNIPATVEESGVCKETGSKLLFMTPKEFDLFIQFNNYKTEHQEDEQLVGGIDYIKDGMKVVAQYWKNENERNIWMNNNKDAY